MTNAIELIEKDSVPKVSVLGERARAGSAVRSLRYCLGFVLLLGAFLADLDTGYELSASLFYIVPVSFAAWFLGRRTGLIVAALGAGAWMLAQQITRVSVSNPSLLYLNAGVEAAVYLATAWAVDRVNADRTKERQLTAQVVAAKEILDREALAVGRLQRDMLPAQLPAVPGYLWENHYATSARAGGDYYDAIQIPDGRIGIMVADAAGHGAPAAVLMAMARALLRADSEPLFPPDEVLARLNRQLAGMLPAGWFLTACFVILDPASGRIEYSLAGHEPPLIVRARTGAATPTPICGGPPLGPFPALRYGAGREVLEPGDTLVLYTDGVTETMNPLREMFGVEGLQRTLGGTESAKIEDVKLRLLTSLENHAAGARIADDNTILMLRRISCSERRQQLA